MQNQYNDQEEEYRQFFLYQQQQQQATSGQHPEYFYVDQQANSAGNFPGQYQYPAQQLAPTQNYPHTASYPGYYHGAEYAGAATASAGEHGWSQSQQWSQPSSSSAQLGHVSGPSETHAYIALPSTPQSTIDTYLSIIQLPESEDGSHGSHSSSKSKRAYLCKWPGCSKAAKGESFKSKDNARVHVHKHFGTDKLFQCILPTCRKQFASEDAAKRHRDTTDSRAYMCAVCHSTFARKDYRDWHQARCHK